MIRKRTATSSVPRRRATSRSRPLSSTTARSTRLEDALCDHLRSLDLAPSYYGARAGLARRPDSLKRAYAADLDRLEPRIAALGDLNLSPREFQDLLAFLRNGLLDPDARPKEPCKQIPETVPSGLKVLEFQGCRPPRGDGAGARGGLADQVTHRPGQTPAGLQPASTRWIRSSASRSRISMCFRPSLSIPDCWKVSRVRLTTSRVVPSSSASI